MTGRRVRDFRPASVSGSLSLSFVRRGGDKTTLRKAKEREPGIGLTFGIKVFLTALFEDQAKHLCCPN